MKRDPVPATGDCPWTEVDADGAGLQLEQFLSFHLVRLANAVQRTTTRAYLDPHELTAPDWRVLGFVRRFGPVQFGELAARTSLDKAQVSRTVRSLRDRGLISTEGDAAHAQRVVLDATPAGRRLHARILPEAARTQARLLHALEPAEREALWRALHKLEDALHESPTPAASPPAPRSRSRKNP